MRPSQQRDDVAKTAGGAAHPSGRSAAAAETTLQTNARPKVVWRRHRICSGSCTCFLMQGDAPGSAPGARAGHKRRAAGTTPVAAELPPGGLILPVGQVPVLSFGGKNVIDPADYKAVAAAVHHLGGKTIANALVLLVEHVAAARARAAHGQPTATAVISACDDDRTDGDVGSAKKSKGGKPKSVLGLALTLQPPAKRTPRSRSWVAQQRWQQT